jgi:hypothetical protein
MKGTNNKKKWSEEDICFLKKYYPTGESNECAKYIKGRTLNSIGDKAKKLGLHSSNWNRWTDKEIELLKFHWKNSTMKDLLAAIPNRSYNMLTKKAIELGVKSEAQRKRIGSLKFLDTLNERSAYWWGFIMADGHITNKGEVIIGLSIKDKSHLKKISDILGCKIYEKKYINSYTKKEFHSCILRIQDKKFGEKWLSILNINSPKTYTPPDLNIFLTKDLLLPFFIGLIDGDGCIWETHSGKDKKSSWLNLRVEIHINWLKTLQLISDKLKEFYNISSKVKTTKKVTSKIEICTTKDLKILKNYIHNVDFLERKWNKLNTLK